jgi:hypothetical protein
MFHVILLALFISSCPAPVSLAFPAFAADGAAWMNADDIRYSGYDGNAPGSGEKYPYLIASASELSVMANKVNYENSVYGGKCYKLTGNVKLEDVNGGIKWTIIGKHMHANFRYGVIGAGHETYPFSGTFDGGGNVVENSSPDRHLFGYILGGTVKNVSVSVGNVANLVEKGGTITNCRSTGPVETDGGVVDHVGSGGTVINCRNTGPVVSHRSVGGIAGFVENGGTIKQCYNTGSITNNDSRGDVFGGIAGRVSGGIITDCYNTGAVTGGKDASIAGGVVGQIYGGVVTNCRNGGAVSSSFEVGGIAGAVEYAFNSGASDPDLRNAVVQNCYNTGPVTGGGSKSGCYYVGGVAGAIRSGNVVDCYSIGPVTASSYANNADFSSFPAVLGVGGVVGSVKSGKVANSHSTGTVTAACYGSAKVAGIGGVVGDAEGGIIVECYSTGPVTGGNGVGGIAGRASSSMISNCYETGEVFGRLYVGGIGGWLEDVWVRRCFSRGDVGAQDASYVGGIAGNVRSVSNIENCYAAGSVSGSSCVGGAVGIISGEASVTDCAALNERVHGVDKVGRVVGLADGVSYVLAGNVAFNGMKELDGGTAWAKAPHRPDKNNGANRSAKDLRSAPGFPRRFVHDLDDGGAPYSSWVFVKNKLPLLKKTSGGAMSGPNGGELPPHLGGRK